MNEKSRLAKKITRNSLYNVIRFIWATIIVLILTPYILSKIGKIGFGVWALLVVFTSYLGLIDLGIPQALTKFIAEYNARKEYRQINRLVNTVFLTYLTLALLIIFLLIYFRGFIVRFFHISQIGDINFIFILALIVFGANFLFSIFLSVLNGLQRIDLANKVGMVVATLNAIGVFIFLQLGYGLKGLVINSAIITALAIIINGVIAKKLLKSLTINPLLFSRKLFPKLIKFSFQLQVNRIGGLFHFQFDKLLLAHFLSVGSVALYEVASRLIAKVREIPVALISPIMPAASELQAQQDKKRLYKLYFRAMKYVILIGLPSSLLVILLANPFINLWLGSGYEKSITTLQILMVPYFITALTGPGAFILTGMGKPQYGMWAALLAMALTIGLNIPLVIKIGYFGVIIGTTVSIIIAASYFIFMFHRIMNIPFFKTSYEIFFKPLVTTVFSLLFIYLGKYFIDYIGWFYIISAGFLYFTLFFSILWFIGYLDSYDKKLIKNVITLEIVRK